MKSKLSSYKKLKEENEKLKQDIYNIIKHPESLNGMSTIQKYNFKFKMQEVEVIWFGLPLI